MATTTENTTQSANTTKEPKHQKLDINTAEADEIAEFCAMLGRKKAEAIIRHREMHGPFKSIRQLRRVPGFAEKLSIDLEDYLTVVPPVIKEENKQVTEAKK